MHMQRGTEIIRAAEQRNGGMKNGNGDRLRLTVTSPCGQRPNSPILTA